MGMRTWIADRLLGDEKRKLNEAFRLMTNAYAVGPYELPPDELFKQVKNLAEYDSSIIWDLVTQLNYDIIGGVMGTPGSYTWRGDENAERNNAIEQCRILFRRDPLAQQLIWVWTNYGFGENITIVPEDENAIEVWDEFWTADRNECILGADKLHLQSENILNDGDIFYVYFISTSDGKSTIRTIDPREIVDCFYRPGDKKDVLFYKRQYLVGNEMKTIFYPDWRLMDPHKLDGVDPSQLPPDKERADKLVEENNTMVVVQHCAHNIKSGWRGWPLLAAGAPWIRAHRNFRQDRASVAAAVAMYVNKLKLKSGSRGMASVKNQIATRLSQSNVIDTNPPAAAGSTWLENDAEELSRMSLGTGASDAKSDGEAMVAMAALSGGIFPHYAGFGDSYKLATACYSDDTEVLTENGWKSWRDWIKGEKIATYDHATKRLVYMEPTKLHVYDYEGKMVQCNGRSMDFLVTPNHRMLVLNENNISRPWAKSGFEVIEAGKLPSRFALPTKCGIETQPTGFITIDDQCVSMDDWLAFVGIYISDGSTCDNTVEIVQSENSIDVPWIRDLMRRLPFKSREGNGSGNNLRWRIYNKFIVEWLIENCGQLQPDRFLPAFVYTDINMGQKRVLLDALWRGDGHSESCGHYMGCYTTTSKRLADDVQRLIIECGYWGSVVTQREEGAHKLFPNSKACYVTHCAEYKKRSLARKKNISQVDYKGVVWCFEAPPYKMFITRRNGHPLIAGNTSMEAPVMRQFSRYQKFWGAQFRTMVRIVLTAAEQHGFKSFTTTAADVSTDDLIDTDLEMLSKSLSSLINYGLAPFTAPQGEMIPENTAKQILASSWRSVLYALGAEDADEITSDEAFMIDREPEPTFTEETVNDEGKLIVRGEPIKDDNRKKVPISAHDIEMSVKMFNKTMPADFAGLLQAEKVEK